MSLKKIRKIFIAIGKLNIIDRHTEKILIAIFLCCITLLLVSQAGLSNEVTRTFFTDIEQYEGVNINDIESVFRQGEITLQLMNIEPTEDIQILLNGSQAYNFSQDKIILPVRNNCLVEVDGTKVTMPFRVKITNISDNISTRCMNKEIEVHSNIEILTRIFLK